MQQSTDSLRDSQGNVRKKYGVSADSGPHLARLQVGGLYQLERLTHHNILILQPTAESSLINTGTSSVDY